MSEEGFVAILISVTDGSVVDCRLSWFLFAVLEFDGFWAGIRVVFDFVSMEI